MLSEPNHFTDVHRIIELLSVICTRVKTLVSSTEVPDEPVISSVVESVRQCLSSHFWSQTAKGLNVGSSMYTAGAVMYSLSDPQFLHL